MKAKALLIICICFCSFVMSCTKTTVKPAEIYVTYNFTASLQYYTDNIPGSPGNIASVLDVSGKTYGPTTAGSYNYTYKLSFENTEHQGVIFLVNPIDGYKRVYFIAAYNSSFEISHNDIKF